MTIIILAVLATALLAAFAACVQLLVDHVLKHFRR